MSGPSEGFSHSVRFNHTKGGFQASEQAFLALEAQTRGQQGIPADQPETTVLPPTREASRELDEDSDADYVPSAALARRTCFFFT